MVQAPEIPDEFYDLMMRDNERAMEMAEEIENNAPGLYKVASKISGFVSLGGIIVAIVAIVKLAKAKEKGKVLPILAIIIIVVFSFAQGFGSVDIGKAFNAGFQYGMENQ